MSLIVVVLCTSTQDNAVFQPQITTVQITMKIGLT